MAAAGWEWERPPWFGLSSPLGDAAVRNGPSELVAEGLWQGKGPGNLSPWSSRRVAKKAASCQDDEVIPGLRPFASLVKV